ncbi:MATE family efflux transporter [Butyrivibrio sp. INlla16]|uniref:MATE family efflux transporter n=1 Tax=Butyrivibrio sp. INlla16 TaxID=1520807 RepID=UPI00088BB792|nr:MATE family efflux transporter [Butyrivibrio sp. INlla16]SDB58147.1 putative efflux protein, MATE family [Butyrivibrio sp. INlla16]
MSNELFEKAPIRTAYLKLAIPVVLSMVVSLVYSMVDTYFIALTGNTALIAGVSICAPLFTLFLAFGDMFALGGTSYISRLLGAGKGEDGKRLSVFCLYGSVAFGIIMTMLLMLFQRPVLTFLGADEGTMSYAGQYYQFIVLGSTLIMASLVLSNMLRTVGQPNASMICSIIGAVVNMVLDPVFIFGFGLGAAGAAIATVIGYVCSDVYAFWFIAAKCDGLSVDPRDFGLKEGELAKIFAVGLPASVTNFTQTLGITLTNRALSAYGSDSIAVMGIVIKIVNIVMLIIVGLAFGGQPLTGYIYGSGKKERLRKVLSFAYRIVAGTAAVLATVVAILAPLCMKAFLKDEALISQGALMLRLQMPGMVLMGLGLVTICTFQSMGKGLPALILSLCRQGVVYAAVIAVFSALFGYMGVISAQLGSDVISVVIAAVLFWMVIKPELASN